MNLIVIFLWVYNLSLKKVTWSFSFRSWEPTECIFTVFFNEFDWRSWKLPKLFFPWGNMCRCFYENPMSYKFLKDILRYLNDMEREQFFFVDIKQFFVGKTKWFVISSWGNLWTKSSSQQISKKHFPNFWVKNVQLYIFWLNEYQNIVCGTNCK